MLLPSFCRGATGYRAAAENPGTRRTTDSFRSGVGGLLLTIEALHCLPSAPVCRSPWRTCSLVLCCGCHQVLACVSTLWYYRRVRRAVSRFTPRYSSTPRPRVRPKTHFIIRRKRVTLALSGPQSRFGGDKSLYFQAICPQNGTAVLKGVKPG